MSAPEEKAMTVRAEHRIGSSPNPKGHEFLRSLRNHIAIREFLQFYNNHDGLELCRTWDARYEEVRPLLEFKPAESIPGFTSRYSPDGDLALTIDLNKCKSLYRNSHSWIAFAEIDSGPACLTIFLDGPNAGNVFYVAMQPQFNNLRPIGKGFNALLNRIAEDVAAFLRLLRVTVTLRGTDGDNYGLVPFEYLPNKRARRRRTIRYPDPEW